MIDRGQDGIFSLMRLLLPKRPVQPKRVVSPRITSYAQKQNVTLQDKYQKAVSKRQMLARARGAAREQGDTNLVDTYKTLEQQTERSVKRLQDEMKISGMDATKVDND